MIVLDGAYGQPVSMPLSVTTDRVGWCLHLDGVGNTVQQIDVTADPIDERNSDERNPFENAFTAKATTLETELQARAHLNLESCRTWKIPTAVSYPSGTTAKQTYRPASRSHAAQSMNR